MVTVIVFLSRCRHSLWKIRPILSTYSFCKSRENKNRWISIFNGTATISWNLSEFDGYFIPERGYSHNTKLSKKRTCSVLKGNVGQIKIFSSFNKMICVLLLLKTSAYLFWISDQWRMTLAPGNR